MSRSFTGTSNQNLSRSSAIISGPPFTMACWARVSSTTTAQAFMSINTSSATNRHTLTMNATGNLLVNTNGLATSSTSTGTLSANTWAHCAGVWSAGNSRTAYLDGNAAATETTAATVTGLTTTLLGARRNTTIGLYLTGQLAECCIWSVALDASEITALKDGLQAFKIRPNSILAYWPLGGHFGEVDEDFSGGGHLLTAINSPTWSAEYPPVFYQRSFVAFNYTLDQSLTLDAINATTTVQQPSITPSAIALSLPLIDAATTVQQPNIVAGATSLGLPTIAATTTVQQPTILPGTVSLSLPLIAATTTVQQPTITAKNQLTLDVISSTTTVYGPTLAAGAVNVTVDTIGPNTTVYQPAITTGGSFLNLDTIAAITNVYGPTISPGRVTIVLDSISSTTTVYQPTIAPNGPTISLDQIQANSQVYQPQIENKLQKISLPIIGPTSQIYAPIVATEATDRPDTSDVLKKRKRSKREIEEENVAAQLLLKRRAEKQPDPSQRKKSKINLKIKQSLIEKTEVVDQVVDTENLGQMTTDQFVDVSNMVAAYNLKQARNKRIRALLLIATMED